MIGFSRKKINRVIGAFLCAVVFVFSANAQALVIAISPEVSYQTQTYRNYQAEKSPYQGVEYGLGVDLKTGRARSPVQFMISGFWNLANLHNTSVSGENQTQSNLGLGAGLAIRFLKLRGGALWENVTDSLNGTTVPLTSQGYFLSGGIDLLDREALQIEVGVRYENLLFSEGGANPALGSNLISESYLFYFSIGYQIGAKLDARSPWGRQ